MTTAPPGRFRLVLAKEDFKFSVAHFTVFSRRDAELLHGHNYRVAVELAGDELNDLGLLADVALVKGEIRRLCGELDSRTLLPGESPLVEVETVAGMDGGDHLRVTYDSRTYLLPAAEAVVLPLPNTTMELLARHLWGRLAPTLADSAVRHLAVTVEETDGQSCRYASPLS